MSKPSTRRPDYETESDPDSSEASASELDLSSENDSEPESAPDSSQGAGSEFLKDNLLLFSTDRCLGQAAPKFQGSSKKTFKKIHSAVCAANSTLPHWLQSACRRAPASQPGDASHNIEAVTRDSTELYEWNVQIKFRNIAEPVALKELVAAAEKELEFLRSGVSAVRTKLKNPNVELVAADHLLEASQVVYTGVCKKSWLRKNCVFDALNQSTISRVSDPSKRAAPKKLAALPKHLQPHPLDLKSLHSLVAEFLHPASDETHAHAPLRNVVWSAHLNRAFRPEELIFLSLYSQAHATISKYYAVHSSDVASWGHFAQIFKANCEPLEWVRHVVPRNWGLRLKDKVSDKLNDFWSYLPLHKMRYDLISLYWNFEVIRYTHTFAEQTEWLTLKFVQLIVEFGSLVWSGVSKAARFVSSYTSQAFAKAVTALQAQWKGVAKSLLDLFGDAYLDGTLTALGSGVFVFTALQAPGTVFLGGVAYAVYRQRKKIMRAVGAAAKALRESLLSDAEPALAAERQLTAAQKLDRLYSKLIKPILAEDQPIQKSIGFAALSQAVELAHVLQLTAD